VLFRSRGTEPPAEEPPDKRPAERTPKLQIQTNLAESALSFTTSFLGGVLETLVLLYFLLASGDLFLRKLARVMPTSRDKEEATAIVHEVQHNISRFLFTITCINVCVATLVSGIFYVVGMDNPLLWGALAGLLNFIPYFGPFTVVIVLTLVGVSTGESVGEGLLPPLIYLGVHALEANFITPMILGRRLTLNPVVIFTSLIFWTWLWGIAGALLAVPLLMTLKIICDHFKPMAPVGEFLSQ
jgi:predicted PurR-regulated permease PerM